MTVLSTITLTVMPITALTNPARSKTHTSVENHYKKPKQPCTLTKKSKHLLQLQYMLFQSQKERTVIRQWSHPVQK